MRDAAVQLRLIGELRAVLAEERVRFWLRGGWALDFHVGRVTRAHEDIDVVTWERHRSRLEAALERAGFVATPSPNPSTQLIFTKRDEELSVLLVRRRGRDVVVRGAERWPFPPGAFGGVERRLGDVTCRVFSAAALLDERERHHFWSGRRLRPKDVESIRILRKLGAGRGA
jgi:Aminoglycoside-2''-adenylyltransferase